MYQHFQNKGTLVFNFFVCIMFDSIIITVVKVEFTFYFILLLRTAPVYLLGKLFLCFTHQ